MEIVINKPLALIVFIFLIFLAGCSADGGRVTARDLLKGNEDADVIKYNGFMYSNVTDLEWFDKKKGDIKKGNEIGKIRKVTTSSLFFTDFSATKLPKGTILYAMDDGYTGIIIVETDDETLYYMQLLEG